MLISHFTVKIYILRIIFLSVFPVWVIVRKEVTLGLLSEHWYWAL